MKRYKNIELVKNLDGKRYYVNPIYPDIAKSADDTYLMTTGGDRYDTLAQEFYGDSTLWWIIASANTSKTDGLIVKPGVQLRVPANPQKHVNAYNVLNNTR